MVMFEIVVSIRRICPTFGGVCLNFKRPCPCLDYLLAHVRFFEDFVSMFSGSLHLELSLH